MGDRVTRHSSRVDRSWQSQFCAEHSWRRRSKGRLCRFWGTYRWVDLETRCEDKWVLQDLMSCGHRLTV